MEKILFNLNGEDVSFEGENNQTLLWVLRTKFELTGTKYGCGEGLCGACTVLINGSAVRSCTTKMGEISGQQVVTIEGLADGEKLHPVQQAFLDYGAVQCGFCTPGMILTTKALFDEDPNPAKEDVIAAIRGNLCRCTGYVKIVEAIGHAAEYYRKKEI